MKEIERFSLMRHAEPHGARPLRSKLLADGVPTQVEIFGYTLLRQFETPFGYLLVTDNDCPYEESAHFTLLRGDIAQILSERSVGAPYCSYWLKEIVWADNNRFTANFEGLHDRWQFTIRKWGIPYLHPQLKMQRLAPFKS